MKRHVLVYLAIALIAFVTVPFVAAQAPGLTTKVLLKSTVTGDSSRQALVVSAELAPRASTGRHLHPGDEYGTVLEGAVEVHIDGQAPRIVRAGEAYHNPKGVVHETRNPGAATTRLLSTFIVETGQPLVQPVK